MSHQRSRLLAEYITKLGKLWPVVGLFGLRQSGKTTLLRDQLTTPNYTTLDDDDDLIAAQPSPKKYFQPDSKPKYGVPHKQRFSWQELLSHAEKGGMPVPMFLRSQAQTRDYWKGWFETSIYRDLARCFKSSYQPEITKQILRTMARVLSDGSLPTLNHFDLDSRRLRNYLEAMEAIFMVRRIHCHDKGVGKEIWILVCSKAC